MTLKWTSVNDLGALVVEQAGKVEQARLVLEALGDSLGVDGELREAAQLLKTIGEELEGRQVRQLSLVEIEERDNPEQMKKAREQLRAERRVARDEERRRLKAEALREAADEIPFHFVSFRASDGHKSMAMQDKLPGELLRERADAIEAGD